MFLTIEGMILSFILMIGKQLTKIVMKKILVFLFLLLCLIDVMAQEQDPWIGTWTSESYNAQDDEADGLHYTDYRYIIKITKQGENYLVRAKTVKVADPNHAIYHDAYGFTQVVKQCKGNSMLIESRREKLPFYVDGQIDSYSNTTSYFKLTIDNGVLHYSFYKYIVESYNKNMRFEYKTIFGFDEKYPGPCVERDMYNDEW